MKRELQLTLDTVYDIRLETYKNFGNSFFGETYDSLSYMVEEIISKNESTIAKGKKVNTQLCNVIALTGDRGSGKSSALSSYCRFLGDVERLYARPQEDEEKEKLGEKVKALLDREKNKVTFTVLDMIDATLLEQEENIIEIILTRMLEKLEEREEENRAEYEYDRKSSSTYLKKKIGNMYGDMHRKPQEDDPEVVALKNLSKSWNLQKGFQKLVLEYVSYMKGKSGGDNYLVIAIDDIDMNVEKCRDMLEMIRKYLMVPRVIIFLTFNLAQITRVFRKHYQEELIPRDEIWMKDENTDDISNLVREYLEKVLPTGRKVYMPVMYRADGAGETEIYVNNSILKLMKNGTQKIRLRNLIPSLLRLYTGIVSISGDYRNHLLYPKSLRKLNNYVKEFSHLQIVSGEPAFLYNLNWMSEDITYRFLPQNVPDYEMDEVKGFLDAPVKEKVYYLRSIMEKNMKRLSGDEMNDGFGRKEALPRQLFGGELSLADSLYILCIMRKRRLCDYQTLVCFQFYLSIIMTTICFEANKDYGRMPAFWTHQGKAGWRIWDDECWLENRDQQRYLVPEGWIQNITKSGKSIKLPVENEEDRKSLENMILWYQLTRMFLIPLDKEGSSEAKDPIPELVLCVRRGKWRFSLMNFVLSIFDYKTSLDEIETEIKEQLKDKDVPRISELFRLKKKMEEWEATYGVRDIIPFYSAAWMERFLDKVYDFTSDISRMDEKLKDILGLMKEELNILDQDLQLLEECVGEKMEWDRFFSRSFVKVFETCPVIHYLEDDGCRKEVAEGLKIVLEEIYNTRKDRATTADEDGSAEP